MIKIKEYTIEIQGTITIKAKAFEDIDLENIRIGEMKQMDITNVHKEEIG